MEVNQNRLVTVERFFHPTEAHIAAGRLQSENIPVYLHGINHISADWLLAGALGGVRLQVPAHFEEHAKDILATDVHFDGSELESCPDCGDTDTTAHTTAWKISFLAIHFLGIPLPWGKDRRQCQACGCRWSSRDAE